jgi:hypothetical protein
MSATRSAADEMTVAEREDQRDKTILLVVCEELVPWTIDEIGRELDDPLGVIDGVGRLARAGLVHRLGEFVFPSRAARRASEIETGTI